MCLLGNSAEHELKPAVELLRTSRKQLRPELTFFSIMKSQIEVTASEIGLLVRSDRHVAPLRHPILALRQRRRLGQPLPEALREGSSFVGRVRAVVNAGELFQVGKGFGRLDAAEFVEIIG
jgi:hypothetical protein